jgi:hypothetical protein
MMAPALTIEVMVEILMIAHHHEEEEVRCRLILRHVLMSEVGIVAGVEIQMVIVMMNVLDHQNDLVVPRPIRMVMIDIVGIAVIVMIGEIDGGIDLTV